MGPDGKWLLTNTHSFKVRKGMIWITDKARDEGFRNKWILEMKAFSSAQLGLMSAQNDGQKQEENNIS